MPPHKSSTIALAMIFEFENYSLKKQSGAWHTRFVRLAPWLKIQ
jgi:hypothetical protein